MSWDVQKAVADRRVGSATKKAILMFFAARASDDGSGIWTAKQKMADQLEMNKRTVQRQIGEMIEVGLISEIGQRSCARGYTVEYRINLAALNNLDLTGDTQPRVAHDHPTGGTRPPLGVAHDHPNNPLEISQEVTVNPLPPLHVQEAFDRYNEAAQKAGWPECQKLSKPRLSKMGQRLKDCGGIEGWVLAMDKAMASDFLCGRTRNNFRATIDFFLQESSFTRLMEGNYDNRGGSRQEFNTATSRPGRGTAEAAFAVAQKLREQQERGPDGDSVSWNPGAD